MLKLLVYCLLLLFSSHYMGVSIAHPHVFVRAKTTIDINSDYELVRISHSWTFDESFTAFAVQGLATNKDGSPTIEALMPLATVNINSMQEYGYFTFFAKKLDNKFSDLVVEMKPGANYNLTYTNNALTLNFDMILKTPLKLNLGNYAVDIYDPEYFVAFELLKDEVKLSDTTPKVCSILVQEPKELDTKIANKLAQLPSNIRELPEEFSEISDQLANRIILKCS